MGDMIFALRMGCHVLGLEPPCEFPPLGFSGICSVHLLGSLVRFLCVYQNFDRYFCMNDEALFGGKVGVHCGEFSSDFCISHGYFSALEQDYPDDL